MEKQIFIPIHWLEHNTTGCIDLFVQYSNKYLFSNFSAAYFTVIGIVNEILADKANCKGIVDVSLKEMYYDSVKNQVYDYQGYIVTYLESEMIANKDDLESAWDFSFQQSYAEERGLILNADEHLNFKQWFNENF